MHWNWLAIGLLAFFVFALERRTSTLHSVVKSMLEREKQRLLGELVQKLETSHGDDSEVH